MRRLASALLSAFVLATAFVHQTADALTTPDEPVVLTVRGTVTQTNRGADAVFDMKMLAGLPQKTFSTRTPWYPEPVTFSGPLLRDVLATAGAKGSNITASALNDYKTDIPFDDVLKHDAIVARLLNGKPMAVREKGPLFIVYPYDSKAELRTEIYYHRSAWQLKSLTVTP